MSGVPIAAPTAPPPAPSTTPAAPSSPVQTEVRIDQAPASVSNPIGSQAPPARTERPRTPADPQSPSQRAQSRREVIAKRYAEAEKAGRPGPAEAKAGHNRPPEPTPREKPALATIDLRKPPPKDEPRPRGEHGHFAARQPQPSQQPRLQQPAPGAQAPSPQQGLPPLPSDAPFREAPPRMHERARAEWARVPESVRGEVHRLHRDFGNAYERLRADHEAFQPLRQYHELARSQGTTLDRALGNYTTMENLLRSNPLQGLATLVHNMNLRTGDGHQITLYDLAYYIATQTPAELQQRQTEHVQSAHNNQLAQLQNTVSQLADLQQRMHYAQAYSHQYFHVRRAVDRFAETHPRMDELGEVIAAELPAARYDMEEAYRRATLLHPAGAHPAAQTRTITPAAQTRALPDRSITGAPAGGEPANNRGMVRRQGQPPPSRRDIIAHAMRRVNGAL